MKIVQSGFALVAVALLAAAGSASAAGQEDREMLAFARDSGCNLCHDMEPRKRGSGELLPYAPAWKDIALKYKGDARAVDPLAKVVMQGGGKSDAERHWKYKTQVSEMPSNTVVVTETDARRLVRWILSQNR